MKNSPILYKKTKTGAIQTWQIEWHENTYRTHEGQRGGTITTSKWTVCEGKNKGKVNETTPQDQAILEAEAKWKKKKEHGYWENIEDVDNGL